MAGQLPWTRQLIHRCSAFYRSYHPSDNLSFVFGAGDYGMKRKGLRVSVNLAKLHHRQEKLDDLRGTYSTLCSRS